MATADAIRRDPRLLKMSNENYRLLSDKLDSFRMDVDKRLDRMVTKNVLIASVIIPLLGLNLAFLGLCVVAVINILQK